MQFYLFLIYTIAMLNLYLNYILYIYVKIVYLKSN